MAVTPVTKVPTGIAGVDRMAHGGLPAGRTTLVSGTVGVARTLLASRYRVGGITDGEPPSADGPGPLGSQPRGTGPLR
jgi:circadian clock protein KaiC